MPWGKRGGSRAWRRKRARILERDNHRCQLAYPGYCLGHATTAHHTQPWDGDPTTAPDHTLIAACQPCNHHAGQPTNPDPPPKDWTP